MAAPGKPPVSPAMLGRGLMRRPEPQGLMARKPTYSGSVLPFSRDAQGTYFDPRAGLLGAIIGGLTAPGDVAMGKLNPNSPEGQRRAMDMVGLMMGGPGLLRTGAPMSALGTVKAAPKWLSAEQAAKWNRVPTVAGKVADAVERATGKRPAISESDSNFGRSYYIKWPHESSTYGSHSIRVSDHSANARPNETRISPAGTDKEIQDQINRLIPDLMKYWPAK